MNESRRNQTVLLRDLYAPTRSYSASIHSNTVTIEDVPPPVDESIVLGFGTRTRTDSGEIFAGYFADNRQSADQPPAYDRGLNIIVGDRVFSLRDGSVRLQLNEGLGTRSFEIASDAESPIVVKYAAVPFKEAADRLMGDPFGYKSSDIFYEIREMARTYAPAAIA